MTAAIIPFPQDLTGRRRTDLSGPCVIMVLPVVRIERHPSTPSRRRTGRLAGKTAHTIVSDDLVERQIEDHGVVDMSDSPYDPAVVKGVERMLSSDASDACAFHFAMLRDCLREQQ